MPRSLTPLLLRRRSVLTTASASLALPLIGACAGSAQSGADSFVFTDGIGRRASGPNLAMLKGGQKRDHADDGVAAAPKTLCVLGFLEF